MDGISIIVWTVQVWIIDKQNRILDKIVGRRKKRRSYEYEVRSYELKSSGPEKELNGRTHGHGKSWVV